MVSHDSRSDLPLVDAKKKSIHCVLELALRLLGERRSINSPAHCVCHYITDILKSIYDEKTGVHKQKRKSFKLSAEIYSMCSRPGETRFGRNRCS